MAPVAAGGLLPPVAGLRLLPPVALATARAVVVCLPCLMDTGILWLRLGNIVKGLLEDLSKRRDGYGFVGTIEINRQPIEINRQHVCGGARRHDFVSEVKKKLN